MADVLVVGAGLAGLSAAATLAGTGLSVLVVDQARAAGGAIHRQPLDWVAQPIGSTTRRRRWTALMAEVSAFGARIEIRCETRFGGIDHTGAALISGAAGGALFTPRAVILATGASERVQPRPGWTLPGVQTAGAIQIALKTTGEAPSGRVVLAGSGPLLLAVAAELVRCGAPPLAIVEAARPLSHPLLALGLPASYQREAVAHLTRLALARVPIFWGSHVSAIEHGDSLRLRLATPRGARELVADVIGLHDGIRPNDYGSRSTEHALVFRAGDCNEALGARAALAHGRSVAREVAARLAGNTAPAAPDPSVELERRAQARLRRIYAHDGTDRLQELPGDTILCRCENRSVNDLRALGANPTTRELRLNGRFGLGACQGRFCAEWVGRIASQASASGAPTGDRWPVRPLSIAEIIAINDDVDRDTGDTK